eukprot:TRINITY_DN9129_c0_g1_i2.p1 TRINITY_DN9129_c0_g1~~TRINITY_DN9129_c0_g1_i2.p1  ORF type:complete len:194 (-),score=43.26 TRINITY_DN9129_c0_g1_i2:289-870(-)
MQGQFKTRILKELEQFSKSEEATLKVQTIGNDLYHWKGFIAGPKDTVYENGYFQIDIQLSNDYPYKPPKMKFDTKIWHPNISSQTGAICLDILKNEWSPALSIRTALLSLQALMCTPEPKDPQDAVVATQYLKEKPQFEKTAREWTANYANKNSQEKIVKEIVEMGFGEKEAKAALEKYGWEKEAALNALLGN